MSYIFTTPEIKNFFFDFQQSSRPPPIPEISSKIKKNLYLQFLTWFLIIFHKFPKIFYEAIKNFCQIS